MIGWGSLVLHCLAWYFSHSAALLLQNLTDWLSFSAGPLEAKNYKHWRLLVSGQITQCLHNNGKNVICKRQNRSAAGQQAVQEWSQWLWCHRRRRRRSFHPLRVFCSTCAQLELGYQSLTQCSFFSGINSTFLLHWSPDLKMGWK